MKHYADLDLMKNRLQQARLDPLYEDPSLSNLQEGRIWYNMSEDVFKYFDGREIQIIEFRNYLTTEDIDIILNGAWE